MIDARGPHAGARQRPRDLRVPGRRWVLRLVVAAALVGVAGVAYKLVDRTRPAPTAAAGTFLEHVLGPPRAKAPLVRRPAQGVTVRLHRDGYGITRSGQGGIRLAAPGWAGAWSRFAGGVQRRTVFGTETITVDAHRTEELLTVAKRQGPRTWRWKLRTSGLEPRLSSSGAVSLSGRAAARPLRIAPVRILDAAGGVRTPAGVHWTLRHAGARSWWLELRLDDRKLPVPYVIDPAVDYPSPLYLSSTSSTETGSWRLVGSAPSGANSTTSTTPTSGSTGYFLFKPGLGNTSSANKASTTPSGTGFIQDLAGGTAFLAGNWSFSIKTQVPGSTLVSGSAILAIGVWKGTISNGAFTSTQRILTPTDDPAAQNIRTSLSPVTTTVTYSLPAFTLASNERLYIDVWRKQVSAINSGTASDRQVNLIVNDGVSRIVHPVADDAAPVNSFQVANTTGGVYFNSPGGSSGTLFYRGSAAGSFRLQDLATDTGSGVSQVSYPAVTTAGWTHPVESVTTGPSYQSSTYSWTTGATASPGAQSIAAQDFASNTTTGTVTITNDTTAPTAPSIVLTSPPAYYTTPSVGLTLTDGTDSGSGVDPASRIIQRDETTLGNGACGTFPGTWGTVVSSPDTTVTTGKCYRYRLLESDRLGNQSTSSASGTAKVDLQPPTQPSLAFSAFTNAAAAGSTVYYKGGGSGSFTVTASGSTDAQSGLSGYIFPSPATWTVTGTGVSRVYSWTAASTPPGALGVHAADAAGNSSADAPFTPTPDSAAPSTTDNSATIGSGWKQAGQTVTLTPTDNLSGVANTYYTTDGSAPTTASPTGTSISLTADAVYTIKYFSVDRVGNAEPVETATTAIRIDKTPGSVTLGALPASIATGQVLTASASDATSGVASVTYSYCTPSPCTPATSIGSSSASPTYPVTWNSQPADGIYDVAARVTDDAGNTGTSAKATVTIDNTPPDTTITAHPSDPSSGPSSFSFASSETGSSFKCSLDGAPYGACSSPRTLSGLTDGTHTFAVEAIDAAGNTDPTPASFTWTVDTTSPDTTITAHPTDPSNDPAASFSFTSSEPGSSFQCSPDGAPYAACSSPRTLSGLVDGTHTFAVRATDAAGNTDPTPATFTWTLDTTAPETTIATQPSDPTNSTSATFAFVSSKTGSSFQCSLDGAAFTACAPPATVSGLSEGPHTFAVEATDSLGNTDPTPATATWTVDLTPPDTTITNHPADPSNDTAPSFSFTPSELGSSFQCSLDGAAYAACSSPTTASGLADGAHTFAVRATDAAGNIDPTPATYTWTVDTVAPDTTITSQPNDPSSDSSPSFAFASTKTPSTFECDLDGNGFTACTSPFPLSNIADGNHTFSVRATDAAGNTDPSAATYSWTINTTLVGATVDEVHYTFTGPSSVAFDWRGSATDIRYGPTNAYGSTGTAHTPTPLPFSSAGPFREVELTGLAPGTTYHYSIGGNHDHTFSTAPTGNFRFDVIADVGSTLLSPKVATVAAQVAGDVPAFVLVPGDLTYANTTSGGQANADQHFNDEMAWSQNAAYMPSWGNHESESPTIDDLRNYKGRFMLPNAHAVPSAPSLGCCGEDWGWFDAGGVRFVSYPERYTSATVSEWQTAVDPVLAAAQADPNIHFVVTYGHEPAYTTGFHNPVAELANALNSFGDRYSKYVLNITGHNHDYERFVPIHGVTNITTGGATTLEAPWVTTDSREAFRALHLEHLRVDVSSEGMRIDAVCGPSTSNEDTTCTQGTVLDSVTIGGAPPPPPPTPVLYVDQHNPVCSDTGLGSQDEPFCTIGAAVSRVNAGQTVQVASGTYPESISVPTSATAAEPILITAAPGASVLVTGGTTGFSISNKSYITINGFTVSSTSGVGVSVQNSSNITLSNNHVSNAGQQVSGLNKSGIYLASVRDSIVVGNTVDHNTSYGIYLNGSTRNLVKANETFSNAQGFARAASGIRLYNSTSNTIDSNRTHNNEDSGIESFTGASNNLIVDNVSYDNGDHGIDNFASTGQTILGNTVYHNVTAGINIEGGSTGATIANNISVDNGVASPRTHSDIRVENGSTAGTTMDYDLAFLTTPDVLFIWNSVQYSTLAAFRTATGQEQHGIQADPRWLNLAARDFHLTAGSPAIDSANSGPPGQPTDDVEGNSRVDDPRTPDTGTGPLTYDDRGAYEFQAVRLDHIVMSPAASTMQAGASRTFTAQGFDPSGNAIGDVTASTTFTISPDGLCNGNVCTATKSGPHTVVASDPTTDSTKTDSGTLQVTPAALDHLVLSPSIATIQSLSPQAYTAEGRDVYDNTLGNVTSSTTFTIAPEGSCTGAACTAGLAGAHTITGTASGKTGTATLQVISGNLDHILVSPSSATIGAGGSRAFTAQGFDSSGNSVGDVTAGTTFSISPDGTCTGAACTATVTGPHTVTANNGGKTSTASLTVNPGPLDHLALSPYTASMAAGGSRTFTAQGRDQYDNSLGDVTSTTTFSIQPDGSCSGAACSATTSGQHTVTGTKGGATGTATLQVDATAVDHLVLSPASASVAVGQSQRYTAEGRDAYGNSTGDVTSSATFSIAPEGSCSGVTCAVSAAGTHTVTASLGGATGTASLDAVTFDHIVISPTGETIVAGGSQAFTAAAFDAAGNPLGDVTSSTTFSIDPDGSCTANVCTATPAWPHTVTAQNAGSTDSTSLFVTPALLDHLVLSADSSITAGASETFIADGRDRYDNSTGDVTAAATFSISPDGSCSGATCTATVAGPHTVTATDAGKTGTFSLDVVPGTLDHLALTPASATIGAGASQSFQADARDAYGNSLGNVTGSATFTIAPDGSCGLNICTPSATGAHTVTGSFVGATGTASLNVLGSDIDHIVISPAAASISAGGSEAYTVEAFDAADESLGDVTPSSTFTIAPDGSCSGNVCTTTVAGAHTVTANNGGKTSTASLTVDPGVLDHLVLAPGSASITAGGAQTYTAQGRDQYNNSLGDVTASTTFTIAANGSCSGTTCTASIAGAHTVTGNDAGAIGTASLQVNSGPLDHIVISPSTATITAGGSRSYTAQGYDAAGNPLGDVTANTTFTIAPDGSCSGSICTTTAAGAHTVTGTDGGKTSTASLTVSPGPLDHLALAPASTSVTAGGTQAYTAQGRDQYNNSVGDVTASTTFTISPNGSCNGAVCTASVAGAHVVAGTRSGKTGTASLQVDPGPLDHIVVSPSTATITAGGSQNYTAQAFDASNNSLGNVTASATFAILPDGSCSASVCTATVAGAHTVVGTYSGKTSTGSLTVNPAPLDHLTVTPASATITAGGSQAYAALARDRYDNSLGDATSSTTFTISPNGSCAAAVCTAAVAGTHTVTGTFLGAVGTAALQVNTGALDHIAISPANAVVVVGTSQNYTAQAFDSSNNSLGVATSSFTFTIGPEGSCPNSGSFCTPTVGGSHTVTATYSGKTALATLNADFVKNPGFETNLTGWNTSGSGTGVTLTQAAGGHSGSWAALVKNTNTTNQTCLLNDSPDWGKPTAVGTYTASLWVRADRAAPLKLRLREYNTSGTLVAFAQSQVTLSTSWQQVSVSYTVTSPNSTLDLNAYLAAADAPPGNCFYADDASELRGVPLDHISVSPANTTMTAGSSQTYTALGFDSANNSLGDVTSATTFSIAPNGSCTGNICTAATPGLHTITANDGGKTNTASLSVVVGPLDHLVLAPASASIAAGGSTAYTAQGFDAAGNSLGDVTSATTFTVAPNGSCSGAVCTASLAGAHTVTGTDAGKTGAASLTVNAGTLDHLALSPSSATITAGGAQTFSADGRDQYNNSLGDVTASTTFTIAPDGACSGTTCVATTAGPHTVTGISAGKTGIATLTVNAGPLDHLALSPADGSIAAGTSQSYTAQGRDQYDNSLGDVTSNTSFTIGPDGSCAGSVCTATRAGSHTISGTKSGKTGTTSLTVTAAALNSLVLSPASASINAGSSQSYTAEGFDQYSNSLGDVSASTTFTIAPDGSCAAAVCSASIAGAHTVTGTTLGVTGIASLTVGAGSLDHIVVSPASASIAAGGSQTYTAQGFDAAGNSLGDVTSSTTFSIAPDGACSGNLCAATVAGAHTVTATNGGKTSTASLAVTPAGLDHLVLSPASASIPAGGSQAYSAEGRDRYDNSLGDVTGATTFSIGPDGSCTGVGCTATAAGAHTVTGTDAGKSGTASLTVIAGTLDHITISPGNATIAAGDSQAYSAQGRDQYGNPVGDVTGATTFSIGPDGSCSGNVCTATVAGAHTVTGTDGGSTDTASLTVTGGSLDHITVSPASATVAAGQTQAFTAQGVDQYGNSFDVTAQTNFSIGPDGSCTGSACTATVAGSHTVTANDGGKTATASLSVTAATLDHLVLSPASASINSGGSQNYTADARDRYGNSLGDATANTTFTIAPDGSCAAAVCTATAAGAHTVTGTFLGATGTASLSVTAGGLDHIAISPASASIAAGGSQTYTAQSFDAAGNSLGDVTASTTFSITPDGSCSGNVCTATVGASHTVTGTDAGNTASATLTVNPGPLDHLVLSPASASIAAGGSQSYTASGFDQYGNSRGDVTGSTTFSIAPDGSCTGSSCTANAAGAHTVTGTGGGASGSATLNVNTGSFDHIVISPASASIAAGDSQAYTADSVDAAGNVLGDVTAATTFSIAPDGSCSGNVCTTTVAGAHTVTGTDGAQSASASLTVNPGPLDHLVLSPASATFTAGGSQAYTAQGRDQYDNSLGDLTPGTTFTIAPNGSCTGATCTATAAGAHTVTGTNSGKTGTSALTVNPGPLDHLALSPASATITAGSSQAYTAQGRDQYDNSLGDLTPGTTFTIAPNGSCTAATCTTTAAGAHTVTGTNSGKTGTSALTVNPGPLDHLALSPASATITAGSSQAYTAQGRDQYDNSLGDLTPGTTFTIAPNGSCTAATCTTTAAGVHTVTGTNSGKTGTASLAVNPGPLDHIAISPSNATIANGSSQTYSAQAFDSFNNSRDDVTAATTFAIAPNGSCTGATCTANVGGTHTVTGTDAGKTSTATLNVDFVGNPGFETNLNGWNASGSGTGVTVTRVAGGHTGGWAAQVANGNTTNQTCLLNDSPNLVNPTVAGTYTGSLWVRADQAGKPLKLRFREYNSGGTLLATSPLSQVTLSTSWQQVTVTYTVTTVGSNLDFNAFLASADAPPGNCFYADDASVLR